MYEGRLPNITGGRGNVRRQKHLAHEGDGGEQDVNPSPAKPTVDEPSSPAAAMGHVQPTLSSQRPIPGPGILTPSPAKPVPPKAVIFPAPPKPPLAPGAVPGPPRKNIDAITAAVLAKLTQQLDEAADTRLKAYTEKVIRFTNQCAQRVEANFQDAANRTEHQMVVSTQQKLGALDDRI